MLSISLSKKGKIKIILAVVILVIIAIVAVFAYKYWRYERSKVQISFDKMNPTITISEGKSGQAMARYDFNLPKIISVRDEEIEKKLKKFLNNRGNYKVKLDPSFGLKNGDKVKLTITLPDLQEFNIVGEAPEEIKSEKTVKDLYDYDAKYTMDRVDCETKLSYDDDGKMFVDVKMTGFAEITELSPYAETGYYELKSTSFYKISHKNLTGTSNEPKDFKNGDIIQVKIEFLEPRDFVSISGTNVWTKNFTITGLKEKIEKVENLDASLFTYEEQADSEDVKNLIRGYIMHSHLSCLERFSPSFPTTSPSHFLILGSFTLSL